MILTPTHPCTISELRFLRDRPSAHPASSEAYGLTYRGDTPELYAEHVGASCRVLQVSGFGAARCVVEWTDGTRGITSPAALEGFVLGDLREDPGPEGFGRRKYRQVEARRRAG